MSDLPRFEVQTNTICNGWVNCWTETDEDGNDTPLRFTSRESAQQELDDFFADIKQAVKNCNIEDEYSLEDYRIVEI